MKRAEVLRKLEQRGVTLEDLAQPGDIKPEIWNVGDLDTKFRLERLAAAVGGAREALAIGLLG